MGNNRSHVDDALRICRTIYSHLECAPSSASKFAGSVKETTCGIEDWIKSNHDVTSSQVIALFNMWQKVKHWIPKAQKNGPHQNTTV